jgi:beta-glucosidase
MTEALGDATNWITHNEPWVATFLGHLEGVFAPGHQDWQESLAVAHHILLSHGAALERIKEIRPDARVGLALDCRPAIPASDDESDVAATKAFDGFRNRWFFDPVFGKGYPDDMRKRWTDLGRMSTKPEWLRDGDLDIIARPVDFVGINYYTTLRVAAGQEESEESEGRIGADPTPGHTEMGWKIDPAGLGGFLRRVHDEYRPPSIMVTENGASYSDAPDESGVIDDTRRIEYLEGHIDTVLETRADGVPVDGYFVWSLLDNLEWVAGYSQRFGLVWVDHDSLRRLPKESFHWYRDRIARGA